MPAGGTKLVTLRAPDGAALGLNRLVFDGAALSSLTARAQIGDRVIFDGVHVTHFNTLYDGRTMRAPLVVPDGTTLDLTLTNPSDEGPLRVWVLAEAYSAAQLEAWRSYRASNNLPEREPVFLWASDDVLAGQERLRLDVPTRSGGCLVTRVSVAGHDTGFSDAAPGLTVGMSAQGRDVIQTTTPSLLARAYAQREMLPGIRLGLTDTLATFHTSTLGTTARVSVLAEAFR